MVYWSEYLANLASYLGTDTVGAGIIVSMLITVTVVFLIAIAGGRSIGSLLGGFLTMIIFTVVGWLPAFIMILIALIVAGLFANQLRKWFGGRG